MSQKVLPRVGISACLLGELVRYDGSHRAQPDLLADFHGKIDWIPSCPEVAIGLGVPRETIRLESREDGIHLIANDSARDLTGDMELWARRRADELAAEGVCGYVFKARSPSCGRDSAKVYGQEEPASGLFAAAFLKRLPDAPTAEEEELATPEGRSRFLALVHQYFNRQA